MPPHFHNFHILTDSVEQAKLDLIHCCQPHWRTSCEFTCQEYTNMAVLQNALNFYFLFFYFFLLFILSLILWTKSHVMEYPNLTSLWNIADVNDLSTIKCRIIWQNGGLNIDIHRKPCKVQIMLTATAYFSTFLCTLDHCLWLKKPKTDLAFQWCRMSNGVSPRKVGKMVFNRCSEIEQTQFHAHCS